MTIVSTWVKNLRLRTNSKFVSGLLDETTIPLYENYLPMLNKEFSRIRRFEHSMVIVILNSNNLDSDHEGYSKQKDYLKLVSSMQEDDKKLISSAEFIYCGLVIKNSIRDIDIIVYDPSNHQFIMIFPETNIVQAHNTIDRIKKIIGNQLADRLFFGFAEFPGNGLILDDLIEYASHSYDHDR